MWLLVIWLDQERLLHSVCQSLNGCVKRTYLVRDASRPSWFAQQENWLFRFKMNSRNWSIIQMSLTVLQFMEVSTSMTRQDNLEEVWTSLWEPVVEFLIILKGAILISRQSRVLFSMRQIRCSSKDSKRKSIRLSQSADANVVRTCKYVFSLPQFQDGWDKLLLHIWSLESELSTLLKTWRTRLQNPWLILQSCVHSRTGWVLLQTFSLCMVKEEKWLYSLRQKQMPIVFCFQIRLRMILKSCMEILHRIREKSPWRDSKKESSRFLLPLM